MTQHVIIAGGGPAGLLTALGLAQAGTRVTVVEALDKLNDSPRALVYHHPVLPYLERLGLLEDCVKAGFTRQGFAWRIHSSEEMIYWSMDCLDDSTPHPYALHLHQGLLSDIAAKHLERLPNAHIERSTRCVGCVEHSGGVTVEVDGPNGKGAIEGDYLVAADGAASSIRKDILGLNFFGITWPMRYIATNTRIDLSSLNFPDTTMQLDDKHGAVLCRIDESQLWRVTFMEDPDLPEEEIPERIAAMFVNHLPDIPYELDDYAPYRMHQRVADRMRVGRVLLVGDSAHVTNPTGGLGLTGGMFDAFALTEALNRVLHDGADENLLEYYETDRRRIFTELVSPRASDNLRRLYYSQPGQQKDDCIEWFRKVSKDKDLMRQEFQFTEKMETKF
ncbi:FAD-dependent oxidoreductase [Pseudohalioglobus lutimaris]|uniref:Para-nitrophenol 4-monooxygenase n=1 Tax=Pseudohalioglobus lutimaris TaxID=1737061 RepID=A0A2N5X5W7_9GAMM|nr:NAD(P)/FAD-dependent oxidoreductase [Pseudohalioglobus lutimaris]PLW69872.1 para-nitrophenol 4-monooxygenase [Pseudohalioglobus lutimaris]